MNWQYVSGLLSRNDVTCSARFFDKTTLVDGNDPNRPEDSPERTNLGIKNCSRYAGPVSFVATMLFSCAGSAFFKTETFTYWGSFMI